MLLFADSGGKHYGAAQIAGNGKYDSKDSSNCAWTVDATGGPSGDACIVKTASANGTPGWLSKAPTRTQAGAWAATASGVWGQKVWFSNLAHIDSGPSGPDTTTMRNTFFAVFNGSWTMFGIAVNPDGTFSLYVHSAVGGVNTLLATSTGGLQSATWATVEIRWLLHATAGSVVIKVNRNTVMTWTGQVFPN